MEIADDLFIFMALDYTIKHIHEILMSRKMVERFFCDFFVNQIA